MGFVRHKIFKLKDLVMSMRALEPLLGYSSPLYYTNLVRLL